MSSGSLRLECVMSLGEVRNRKLPANNANGRESDFVEGTVNPDS
jgi:hypothetical protein